jgi:hypothetical protein
MIEKQNTQILDQKKKIENLESRIEEEEKKTYIYFAELKKEQQKSKKLMRQLDSLNKTDQNEISQKMQHS